MLSVLLATAAAGVTLPAETPLLCLDGTGTYQPVQRTNYGAFKQALRRQFGFTATLTVSDDTNGRLVFRGGVRGAETITYAVEAKDGGIALTAMHVRLKGTSEDLTGNNMCWRTWSIING
ncbi:hypothetical protein FPZ24_01955 [Sphingomonas panacisoli]|uniref:Uncharacterized protein n=1 Tax=Sphingomonas panacisoli TaxID=1813879 RepID=A0A5B8LDX7_9SPHN|nr:hypothetical protein [Sphingomonas panacisoli]QDZ06388.1 hypothetical protein FPZ24_01955 [Sphingomonas panacisoli]